LLAQKHEEIEQTARIPQREELRIEMSKEKDVWKGLEEQNF